MAKMTRERMLVDRRCGLKYWDEAVRLVGQKAVLDRTLGIMQEYPDTWGRGWPNAHWAIGNAVREIIKNQGNIQMTWNIHDVLTPEELADFASQAGLTGLPYKESWSR